MIQASLTAGQSSFDRFFVTIKGAAILLPFFVYIGLISHIIKRNEKDYKKTTESGKRFY